MSRSKNRRSMTPQYVARGLRARGGTGGKSARQRRQRGRRTEIYISRGLRARGERLGGTSHSRAAAEYQDARPLPHASGWEDSPRDWQAAPNYQDPRDRGLASPSPAPPLPNFVFDQRDPRCGPRSRAADSAGRAQAMASPHAPAMPPPPHAPTTPPPPWTPPVPASTQTHLPEWAWVPPLPSPLPLPQDPPPPITPSPPGTPRSGTPQPPGTPLLRVMLFVSVYTRMQR